MARQTRTRPSVLVGVIDEWAAYQLDSATVWFGTYIENKLNEMDETTDSRGVKHFKPKYTLDDFLGDDVPTAGVKNNLPSADEMRRIGGMVVR